MAVANEYLEMRVTTAPRQMLHLMVVEGAIRFAKIGCQALEQKDFETSHFALERSRACVNELLYGLDSESNPELIDRLRGLFLFVHQTIVTAGLERDIELLRDAIQILELHRETWLRLVESLSPNHPAGEAPLVGDESTATSWLT